MARATPVPVRLGALDDELDAAVAAGAARNKSEAIREAVEAWLDDWRRRQRRAADEAAYTDHPEDDDDDLVWVVPAGARAVADLEP